MKNKKLTASEKGMLVNEQRFSMIVLLCNVLDAEDGVSDAVKSAVAASLLNTIEMKLYCTLQLKNNGLYGPG
jgi:hypothetical protein